MLEDECNKLIVQYTNPVTPVVTRWNSECMCLESCFKNKNVIIKLSEFHDLAPNPRGWDLIEEGITVLGKFKVASELWRGVKNPSLHTVIPVLFYLCGHLKTFLKDRIRMGMEKC